MLVLLDKDISEIFSEDVEAIFDKYFDDKKVSKNDLSRLIFKECCMNMRKTIDDPKKKNGIRYSPLLLRHATVLRNKLKDDKYSFLAKTFGYPSTTTLNRYSSSSWKDENGLCNKVLDVKRSDFEQSNKCLDRLDFERTGSLSQDAMMTKEKLCFDKHGMRIVGTADDAFNENGIDMELKLLAKKYEINKLNKNNDGDSTGEETKTNSETTTKLPLAKYYLTFFFKHGIGIVFQ